MSTMKRTLLTAVPCVLIMVLLCGCAVVSNVRRQEGNSEKHIVAVLGIPLWWSERPIDRSEKGE